MSESLINDVMRQRKILAQVLDERDAQDTKWGANRNLPHDTWFRILGEEFGEVAHALNESDEENLREELIQVMASAMAWLENFDRNTETKRLQDALKETLRKNPIDPPKRRLCSCGDLAGMNGSCGPNGCYNVPA